MSKKLEIAQDIIEAAPGVVDLILAPLCYGIFNLVNVIKYDRCEIFIQNNHHHKISVAIDTHNNNIIKGWFNIEPFSNAKIYKTDRATNKVGIYAECCSCDSVWGSEENKYIPSDGNAFDFEYDYSQDYSIMSGYKPVKFSYSSVIRKEKKYTFNIN
jgi:hypothetical protein